VKDALPCAAIAFVDFLTFLPSYSLTVRLRMPTQRPNGAGRFTTKTPRDQEKTHREDGEEREERFHHQGTKDTQAR
jgi:hypothetical protein